jgi:hypothetical protein
VSSLRQLQKIRALSPDFESMDSHVFQRIALNDASLTGPKL